MAGCCGGVNKMLIKKTVTILTESEAKEKAYRYPFSLCYSCSGIQLGVTPLEINWEEITEARFFGDKSEIHIFFDEEGIRVTEVTDEESDEIIDLSYKLESHFGEKLTVRRYINFDEDGQAQIIMTRLLKWKG